MKNPALKVETEFNKALATLGMVQDCFVGDDRDRLNDDIIFWTIEAAKDQLKAAWFKLDGREFGMAV